MGRRLLLCMILVLMVASGGCKRDRSKGPARSGTPKQTRTLLHRAAGDGNAEAVRSLIAHGADVDAKDGDGETPLHVAASEAPLDVVHMLIAHGADVNARDRYGHAPLDKVFYGSERREEIAEFLIRNGAKATVEHLISAARAGYTRLVELLITQGIDVNARGKDGSMALHAAVGRWQKEVAKLLLAKGADVNAETLSRWGVSGSSTLHVAATRGSRDLAALLIDGGANLNAKDSDGRTPLHVAAADGHYEVARLLVEKGSDVNAEDSDGDTPLYAAVLAGDSHTAEQLINAGADAKVKNRQGQTLLHTAILSPNSSVYSDTIALLIAGGADVNAVTPSGCTALHYAAREGQVRTAELLLAHGANATAKTTLGQTPLHLAVCRGHEDIVTLLIEKGADTSAKDRDGKTPLDHARAAGYGQIVALLTGDTAPASTQAEQQEIQADSAAVAPSERRREPQTDVERLISDNSSFAVDLYERLRAREGNLFFSPYSVSTALAMAYAGAFENTEMEMAKTLCFSMDQQRLHPAFANLQAKMNRIQEAGHTKLCLANSLWPQAGHPFLKEYLSLIERHYGVSATAVDYQTDGTREAARQTINRWIEGKTENRIKDLIQADSLTDRTRLVLTNAIYFKGKWKNEFDAKDTKDAAFFVSPAKSVQVPTMHQEEVFRYAQMKSWQILELPYRGGALSMLVLLPTRIEGLKPLERSLSVEDLQEWRSYLHERKVIVFLPKFRMTFRAELKATLQSMGMLDAFKWPEANFAGFDGDPRWFYIGEVIHKTYVDVNEEGTEAAAATAVEGMMGGMPPQPPVFRVDHPFLFLIQENSTGSILFMGRVANPVQAGQ